MNTERALELRKHTTHEQKGNTNYKHNLAHTQRTRITNTCIVLRHTRAAWIEQPPAPHTTLLLPHGLASPSVLSHQALAFCHILSQGEGAVGSSPASAGA